MGARWPARDTARGGGAAGLRRARWVGPGSCPGAGGGSLTPVSPWCRACVSAPNRKAPWSCLRPCPEGRRRFLPRAKRSHPSAQHTACPPPLEHRQTQEKARPSHLDREGRRNKQAKPTILPLEGPRRPCGAERGGAGPRRGGRQPGTRLWAKCTVCSPCTATLGGDYCRGRAEARRGGRARPRHTATPGRAGAPSATRWNPQVPRAQGVAHTPVQALRTGAPKPYVPGPPALTDTQASQLEAGQAGSSFYQEELFIALCGCG